MLSGKGSGYMACWRQGGNPFFHILFSSGWQLDGCAHRGIGVFAPVVPTFTITAVVLKTFTRVLALRHQTAT